MASIESVDQQIRDIVKEFDKSISLKPKQLEVLRYFVRNDKPRDIIANLPVGYGKSLLYQILPRLLKTVKKCVSPVVIFISPLNVIQLEQVEFLAKKGVRACKLPYKDGYEKDPVYEEVMNGKFEVVFAHPEALLNTSSGTHLLGGSTFVKNVVAVVIDECHIVETWGEEFRTAFKKLKTLPAVFEDQPFLALSGTLTSKQIKKLPTILGLNNPVIVQESPDRKNIFLKKLLKTGGGDVLESYENIFKHECDNLKMNPDNYPVTLLFLPLFYMSQATAYLKLISVSSRNWPSWKTWSERNSDFILQQS